VIAALIGERPAELLLGVPDERRLISLMPLVSLMSLA
jgi:hypothetical protein